MPNISRNKANQAMKLSQVIEYNARNILFKNHGENKTGRLVPNLVFLKKLYIRKKQVVSTLGSISFGRHRRGPTIKTSYTKFQTAEPEICSILIFDERVWD